MMRLGLIGLFHQFELGTETGLGVLQKLTDARWDTIINENSSVGIH